MVRERGWAGGRGGWEVPRFEGLVFMVVLTGGGLGEKRGLAGGGGRGEKKLEES